MPAADIPLSRMRNTVWVCSRSAARARARDHKFVHWATESRRTVPLAKLTGSDSPRSVLRRQSIPLAPSATQDRHRICPTPFRGCPGGEWDDYVRLGMSGQQWCRHAGSDECRSGQKCESPAPQTARGPDATGAQSESDTRASRNNAAAAAFDRRRFA